MYYAAVAYAILQQYTNPETWELNEFISLQFGTIQLVSALDFKAQGRWPFVGQKHGLSRDRRTFVRLGHIENIKVSSRPVLRPVLSYESVNTSHFTVKFTRLVVLK